MNEHQPILRNLTYNAASAVQAIIAGDLRLAMEHLEDEIQRTKRVGVLIARDLSVERQVIVHAANATMMPIQPSMSPVDVDETPTPLDLTGFDVPEWANFAAMDEDRELRYFAAPARYSHNYEQWMLNDVCQLSSTFSNIFITQPGIIPARSLTPIVRPAKPEPRRFDVAAFADKIPANAKWVAMDGNGEVNAFVDKPIRSDTRKVWNKIYSASDDGWYFIVAIDPTGINWRETLTPVNQRWWERTDETTVTAAELEREYERPLPKWAEWVAIDNHGFQFVYQEEPIVIAFLRSWGNLSDADNFRGIGKTTIGPIDWRTTKRRIIR